MGFDEVLHRETSDAAPADAAPEAAPNAPPVADLTRELTEAVRLELAKNSIRLNHRLELRVHSDGSLRVDGDHPEAARIEALLNQNASTLRLASQLRQRTGVSQISIDLTSAGELENMVGPGGYPNW